MSYEPLEVGCIVKVRIIGVLVMEDKEEGDPKGLSAPTSDPRFDGYNDLIYVHPHKLLEIQEFEVHERLEPKKWVIFKTWKNAEEAKNREIFNYSFSTRKTAMSNQIIFIQKIDRNVYQLGCCFYRFKLNLAGAMKWLHEL